MALYIYETADPSNPYSQDGSMTNPLRQAFDGRTGGVEEKKLYLRNNSASVSYSGVQIQPVDTGGRQITDGTDGYSWKLKEGNEQPTADEWELIEAGSAITMSGLTDTATYLPFWSRAEVPRDAEVESHDQAVLRITFVEY